MTSFRHVAALLFFPLLASSHAGLTAQSSAKPLSCAAADTWARAHDFSGAVLLERGGVILERAGFGEADREHHVPVTPDTVFRIGSISKLFTTTATLREVADGHLKLDTPLCDFLKNCPASWKPVTVSHALTHTDGLPDIVRQPGL